MASERLLSIKHLVCSSNPLESWPDLEALSLWCPKLEVLSASDIPANGKPAYPMRTDDETDIDLGIAHSQSRSLIIARFPNLTRLDGTLVSAPLNMPIARAYARGILIQISERERRDSEILYLSLLAREGSVEKNLGSTPFRWAELCQSE